MMRWLTMSLLLFTACGCGIVARDVWRPIFLPEQRTIEYREPASFPTAPIPASVSPYTVAKAPPKSAEWQLSLDDAIRIALENARTIRVLAGTTAVASGKTIYDAAITNTTIDQATARFDPTITHNQQWSRTNAPSAITDPNDFTRSIFTSNAADAYLSTVGLSKINASGGQAGLTWIENPIRFPNGAGAVNPFFPTLGPPLNPQNADSLALTYTQPFLQGGGFRVNKAPIVIARLNTEISFFQYKDSVQEMVRGVIDAYWNLVQARIDVQVRKEQVQETAGYLQREEARLKVGIGDKKDESLARVTHNLFRANLIGAEAIALNREAVLRNLLGLPPSDDRYIVPTSVPANERLSTEWDKLVQLAEQRRPDIIELKIIIEAEQQRLVQAENAVLPKLDGVAMYRWNGLSGTMPNNERLVSSAGKYADWTLGINFSVPLGLRQGRAQVRQEKLVIERDRENLNQGLHAALHELASSARDQASAYEQYLAYKIARAAAEANESVQKARVKVGNKTGFDLEVRQAIIDLGDAKISEAAALVSYNIALATLERRTGTILETHGLVFNEERFRAAGPLLHHQHEREYPSAIVPKTPPAPRDLKAAVHFLPPVALDRTP